MKYEILCHPITKVWEVWETRGYTSEIVKRFKTQAAAERWVARHS